MAGYLMNEVFLGTEKEAEEYAAGLRTFFAFVHEMNGLLGEQAYLLDDYLARFMQACTDLCVNEAAGIGFEDCSALFGICRDVVSNGIERADQAFFEEVQAYAAQHPLPVREPATRRGLYQALLTGRFSQSALRTRLSEATLEWSVIYDEMTMQHLSERITEALGDDSHMERLNTMLQGQFIRVSYATMYLHGVVETLQYTLAYQDIETRKTVIELIANGGQPLDE